MKFLKNILILTALFVLAVGCIYANEELPEISQITTHPQMDFQPAISPDGKWMAFVSSRSGNLDIWIKPLPRGRAIQITTDRSDDIQPVWMPDGKKLIFTSKRRDAMGDLWQVGINNQSGKRKGNPKQITTHLGWDQSPTVSPDGQYVAYVSDLNGGLQIYVMHLKTRRIRVLSMQQAVEPVWSPDGEWLVFTSFQTNPSGDLILASIGSFVKGGNTQYKVLTSGNWMDAKACWSSDGRSVIFQRIHDDTNGDGKITPEDHASLWKKSMPAVIRSDLFYQPEFQLTTSLYHDVTPSCHDTLIYFTSNRGGGEDIWTMPIQGLIPDYQNVNDQYLAVFDRFGMAITPPGLYQAILGYRKVLTQFPNDSVWCARSWIRIAELYVLLELHEKARQAFEIVQTRYADLPQEVATAKVKEAAIPYDDISARILLCKQVIQNYSDQKFSVNEARLLLGDLYQQVGDGGNSVAAYTSVIQHAARYVSLVAQARLRIGDLFQSEGQKETARQSYLAVLREYGSIPLWRQRAIQRIMEQVEGSIPERIAAYQDIQIQASDLPALMAEAQLAIGSSLMESHQYTAAIRELEQVDLLAPSLTWAQAKSRLIQAEAYNQLNDFLKAKQLLEEVIQEYNDTEGGRYRIEAEQQMFDLAFEMAEASKADQDFPMAVARYQMAMVLHPTDIRVHRGLIEATYYWQKQRRNGKLDALIEQYQNQLANNPDQPVIQYSLGLALSYVGERDTKILESSNIHLTTALENDYRMIYPYRTLGYNYELMERLAEIERNKKPGIIKRTGKVLFTPARWIMHLFKGEADTGPVQYYEKAIEVLTTAIELNDEKTDPRLEAELAQNLANNFYNLGEYGFLRAYRYYQKRLSLDTTFYQPLEKAIFYSRAGHCALGLDEYEDAERFFKISIGLFEQNGREAMMVQDQGRLAYLYQARGDHQEAIGLYEALASRDIRQKRWDAAIRDYRNIAYNYHLIWEPEDAIQYAEKAESILKTQKIPKGPPEKSYLRWEFFGLSIPIWGMEEIGASSSEGFTLAEEAALIYIIIGKNAERLKDFQKAMTYEQKRFDIFQSRKDKLAQRISMNRMGMLNIKLNQLDAAWGHFLSAYEMSRKAKDMRGRWINAVNLGQVAAIQLSQMQDLKHFTECLQILQKEKERLQTDGTSFERQSILSAIGTLIFYEAIHSPFATPSGFVQATVEKLDKLSEADRFFKDAQALAKEAGLWREEAIVLKSRGEISILSGDFDNAARMLNQAEAMMEKGGETQYLWRVHYSLAGLSTLLSSSERDSMKLKSPMQYFQSALEGLEALPVTEEDSELRLADRPDRWHVYLDAALAYASSGDPQKSFTVIERGREKRLADILARRPPALRRERHKNLWQNLRDIRAQLGDIRKQILTAESKKELSGQLTALEQKSDYLYSEYQTVIADIQDEDPVLSYLSGASDIQIPKLQSYLNHGYGALSYILQPGGLTLYAIDHDTLLISQVSIDQETLQKTIDDLVSFIQENKDFSIYIEKLSKWLIEPVQGWVETKTHLVIIPDEIFWQVPFELLKIHGESLVDFYTLSYAPSLMGYHLATERRKINQSRLLFVGNPRDIDAFGELPQQINRLTGLNATESQFKQEIANADIVHLECWMLPNEKSPLQAAMVLSSDSKEDGYIRPEELFGWDLPASFVKLPESRICPAYRSLELYYYAFLYSGVPSMLWSRWPQTFDIKSKFFNPFYRKIMQHSLVEASAMTEIELRDKSQPVLAWSDIVVLGYEGMNESSRLAFARRNLVSTVLSGRNYIKMGEYADAIVLFEQALNMAVSLNDSTSIRGILLEIIRAGMEGELWEKAITYQKRFIDQFGSMDNLQVAQQNLVTFYYRNGQFNKAADAKIHAIERYKSEEKWEEVAQSAMELAVIYASARDYDASIQWADEAYRNYLALDQSLGKARALIWKGRSLLDSDRYFESRAAFSLAIEILEKSNPNGGSGVQLFELATAYQLRGICLENLSFYQEALEDQEHALGLLEALDRPLQKAQGQQYLANVNWKMGLYRQALVYQAEALKSFESQGQRKQLAMAYSTQGLIQMSLGDLNQAKVSQEKAYSLARAIQSQEDEATILKNMGQIAIQEQDLNKAFGYFQEATNLDSSLNLRRGLAYDYRNQGMLLIQMQQLDDAIKKMYKGLTLSRDVQDLRNQIQCYYGLGLANMQLEHYTEGLAVVDSGLALTEKLVIPELTWRLYRLRGKINWALKDREKAHLDFVTAVGIVEQMRAELKVETFKQGFFDSKIELYQDIIQLLLQMQKRAEAFHYVERAKSRDFIDLLANHRISIPQNQSQVLNQEKVLKLKIQEAQNQIIQIRSSLVQNDLVLWEDSLSTLRASYESLMNSIQANNPELASFISVDPWTVEQIQNILPDSTAILEYYWGDQAGYCWVVTKHDVRMALINVAHEQLGQTIQSLREGLISHLSVDQESRLLHQWLILPVSDYLDRILHVIVVPHGVLHYLPFAALQYEDGYLIDSFSISLAPSSTVLGYCLSKGRPFGDIQASNISVTAFGNPDLGNPAMDLAYAEKELVALERSFSKVASFYRGEATENKVKEYTGKEQVLHFACHATYEAENPLFSALLLTPTPQNDGRLEAQEIFGLQLHCDLVSLSACETGLGKITGGDEIIGLSRSFIYAGTPSILTSLWKVDDLATAVMMKRFYRYLAAGKSRAEALRQVQLIVRELVNPHPSAWAAFNLTGDFR